jgi:hypothetical protein
LTFWSSWSIGGRSSGVDDAGLGGVTSPDTDLVKDDTAGCGTTDDTTFWRASWTTAMEFGARVG